jgi:GNAT superfamily N-acetyltransferase
MIKVDRSPATILPLGAHSPELKIAALWRYDAFLKEDGFSLADSEAQLTKLATAPEGPETALIARVGGRVAGICLLVMHELESAHSDLSPWLASLYVDPGFRGQGVARRFVAAIEDHARRRGVARLHLYTVDAEDLYRKCGWAVADRFVSEHGALVLMTRDL